MGLSADLCQTSLAISPLKHRYQERQLVQLQLTILLTIRRSGLFTRPCTHCFSGIWGSSRDVCPKGATFEGRLLGTCLVVQWLRLCAPNAGGLGSIPGRGTRPHTLLLRVRVPQLKDPTRCAKDQSPHGRGRIERAAVKHMHYHVCNQTASGDVLHGSGSSN